MDIEVDPRKLRTGCRPGPVAKDHSSAADQRPPAAPLGYQRPGPLERRARRMATAGSAGLAVRKHLLNLGRSIMNKCLERCSMLAVTPSLRPRGSAGPNKSSQGGGDAPRRTAETGLGERKVESGWSRKKAEVLYPSRAVVSAKTLSSRSLAERRYNISVRWDVTSRTKHSYRRRANLSRFFAAIRAGRLAGRISAGSV